MSSEIVYCVKNAAKTLDHVAEVVRLSFEQRGFVSQRIDLAKLGGTASFQPTCAVQIASEGKVGLIAGTNRAATLSMAAIGDDLAYQVYGASWMDKAAAVGVGVFLFAPTLITAGFGMLRQSRLLDEVKEIVPRVAKARRIEVETLEPWEWWANLPQAIQSSLQVQCGLSEQSTAEDLARVSRCISPAGLKIECLSPFKMFRNLEHFELASNGLNMHSVTSIAKLTCGATLKKLVLPQTRIGSLTQIGELVQLEELSLNRNWSGTVLDLESLAGLSRLRSLDLRGCNIRKDDLKKLTKALPRCRILSSFWFI